MTNEEAIDVLEHNFPSSCYADLCEAVNVAIEALQRETSDDAISRRAAIEGLKGYIDDTGIFNQDKWFVHGIKTAITHLKSLPSVQSGPQWISCSERLPEDKTAYYLATVANRGLFFTTTVNNNVDYVRWDYDRRKGKDSWHWRTERTVLAWMPLPEPWKEGGRE